MMSKKAFETLWASAAALYLVAVYQMFALSQGWAWTLDTGLEQSPGTEPVIKTVAAYLGAPLCLALTIAVFYLSRHFYQRHGFTEAGVPKSRWQRMPVPWDWSIPATDPIGKKYRANVWLLIFVACPYGTAHLVRKTFNGDIWMECEVVTVQQSLRAADCDAIEAQEVKEGTQRVRQDIFVGDGWGAHFSLPSTRDYFDHRYQFGAPNGYTYFPVLYPALLLLLAAWALVEVLVTWWRLLK
jgi:hypothetical protein